MSNYNSQLQSNNTDLQKVLQTLQTKAAGNGEQVEWSANEDDIVGRNIETYFNDRITKIGNYAFNNCSSLTTVNFPAVTTIGTAAFSSCSSLTTAMIPAATNIAWGAFNGCVNLTTISFPKVTSLSDWTFADCSNLSKAIFPACELIFSRAFNNCDNLTTISFPKTRHIHGGAFYRCRRLTTASFPVAETIGYDAFMGCYNLKSLYLTGSRLCTLSNSNAFTSTPIGGYSTSAGTYGSIYVPASLLTSYQKATNWTYFSSRFVAYYREGEHHGGVDD